jgi:phage terminase large subunit-like protein
VLNRFEKLRKKHDYDPDKANDAIGFIESLTHIEGEWAGQKFKLADFQRDDIIKPVFGLVEKGTKNRLIKECYIEIPKKNGKTTLMSSVELYLLFGDGEEGAQIYNCAGDDGQAELLYRTAKFMLLADPYLKSISRQLRTEIHWKNRYIKKLTSKADTKHGLNAHGVIYDELHAAQDRELFDTLKFAGSQRRQPLFIQITTAGYDKTSICWERHEYTRKINEGIIEDDNFWGVIYTADEKDWQKEESWKKANPIWDYSETFQKNFKKDFNEAKNNATIENAFKRLHLNIWTASEEKWVGAKYWEKGNLPLPNLEEKECYGGLDLASRSDTASLVLAFPIEDKYYLLPFIFVPEEMIDVRDRRNETFYFKWAKEGYLIRTPGNVIDYRFISKTILECKEKFDLKSIGYDPYNALQIILQWQDDYDLKMEEYTQTWKFLSEPTKEFEALLMDDKIIHGGHPVLKWMADNAVCIKDNNDNYRIAKGKHSKDKVDGIQASIMAIAEALRFKVESKSVFTGTW